MAVKCILTGQTPSVLDGVTENVQSQIDNKVNKVTGKGLSTEDYTTTEKTKLSGIEEGAQKNTVTSVAGKTGAVTLAKDDVGLSNVDNTSDENKPISTATQTALDNKQDKLPSTVTLSAHEISLSSPLHGVGPTSFQTLDDDNSFVSVTYSSPEDVYYGFSAPLADSPADGQKPNEIYLARLPIKGSGPNILDFTTPVSLKNVADPTDPTDAMNLRSTEEVASKKVAVNGILKGDGTGTVTAAVAGIDYVSSQNVLTKDNIVEYVPSEDYHPATKKYVDSKAGASSTLRVGTLSIPTSGWIGEGPYTQVITIPEGNSSTKVDIQVDDNAIQQMIDNDVSALYISNTDGVFTVHAVGEKPSVDLTIQISCSEANIIQI